VKTAANYHFIRGGWDDPNCASSQFPIAFSRVAWSILDCARRTSTFLSCAFREQEDDQATLPSPLAVPPSNPYTDAIAIQPGLNSPARSFIN